MTYFYWLLGWTVFSFLSVAGYQWLSIDKKWLNILWLILSLTVFLPWIIWGLTIIWTMWIFFLNQFLTN